jgi:hypothetical protein
LEGKAMRQGKTTARLTFGDGRETTHVIDGVAETAEEEGGQMEAIIAAACVAGLDLTGIEFDVAAVAPAAQQS